MIARLLLFLPVLLTATVALADAVYSDLDGPAHRYRDRTPQDAFSKLIPDLQAGRVPLDLANEKATLISLLKLFNVPASSQALVFSTTSLQLRLISPANPRALYFNEDVYVGYIPGGRLEIVALDPELGGVFYLCDIPRAGQALRADRSERCMNCHAAPETGNVPGLVLKSVVPGVRGGSLMSFRQGQIGHGVPFGERFGGWYVTGSHGIPEHLGNTVGQLTAGALTKFPLLPGERFDFARYPVGTSDILPQLVLEHQAGFANRVIEAGYRARFAWHVGGGTLTPAQASELDAQARLVTRYLLFADEVPLSGPVEGDPAFKSDFLANRRPAKGGASLKDFDLQTRLFRLRCSYMIYSPVFIGLPVAMKQRVYSQLGAALDLANPAGEYAYLPAAEKSAIRDVLRQTLTDLPAGW